MYEWQSRKCENVSGGNSLLGRQKPSTGMRTRRNSTREFAREGKSFYSLKQQFKRVLSFVLFSK
jgi:hypothetical protein